MGIENHETQNSRGGSEKGAEGGQSKGSRLEHHGGQRLGQLGSEMQATWPSPEMRGSETWRQNPEQNPRREELGTKRWQLDMPLG